MDRAEAVREMTFEEEAVLYQQEAKAIFAKEDEGYEAPPINHTVRRGMRIIRKAREEIAALREQESLAQATSKWVSVEEPPKTHGWFLTYGPQRRRDVLHYNDEEDVWSDEDDWNIEVTHWMPLSEPPKEGAERTCKTCCGNDMEHDEADNPCWNCKGDHSEWMPKEGAEG